MKKRVIYKNFDLISGGEINRGGSLIAEDGVIAEIIPKDCPLPSGVDCELIDGEGKLYLSPGFIDLHTHGGGGFDFMDADAEEYRAISRFAAAHGVTALYPTTLSASEEELISSARAFETAKDYGGGARLLGMHLEGPYLAASQKGAMDEKYIRAPRREEYERICAVSDGIRRMTIAPEVPGAAELGAYLRSRGILPSVGHTDCDCADVERAYAEGGFTLMTHLYSSMTQTRRVGIYRHAGAVEAAYLIDGMNVEIIADGCHLPPELLRLIYKLKGPRHIALITDSMRGAGSGSGESILGSRRNGQRVIIDEGVAKMPDMTAFAGSVATFDRLVRTMRDRAGVPLAEVIRMSGETPAAIMGVTDCGTLDAGKRADLTAFDERINIRFTAVAGNIVYRAE